MKFVRLQLTGFGKFVNREIELREGFNLIYGGNEAGKSTLHAFIRGMLYGFKKPATIRRYFTAEQERYRPWLSTGYAGSLEYAAGGNSYLVRRDFDRDETHIYDALTGAEITGRFRQDRRREYDFAEQHTGLSVIVFNNTVSVRQMGIAPEDELAAEVSGRLANLGSAGLDDVPVQNALTQLQKAAEQIGSSRAGAKPHGRAAARVAALAAEMSRTEEILTGLRESEVRLAACRNRLAGQSEALAATEAALHRAKRALLRQRLAKARVYRARRQEIAAASAALARYAEYPLEREEAVRQLLQAQREKEVVRQEIAGEIAALTERRREIERETERQAAYNCLEEVDLLTLHHNFNRWCDLVDEVGEYGRELAARRAEIAATDAALAPYRPYGEKFAAAAQKVTELDESLRYREEAAAGRKGQKRVAANQLTPGRIAAAVLAAAGGYAGYLFGNLWLSLLGAAITIFLLCYRRSAAGGQEKAEAMEREMAAVRAELAAVLRNCGATGVQEFREKKNRYNALLQRREMQAELTAAAEGSQRRAAEKAAERRAAIGACLAAAGLLPADGEPTKELVEAFSTALRANLELRREKASVSGQIAARREKLAAITAELQKIAAELTGNLDATGAADAAEFLHGCERRRAYDALQEQMAGQTNLLDAVLQGMDYTALEAAAAGPDEDEAVADGAAAEDLAAAADRYREEISRLSREQVELETTIETRLRGLRSPALIAEEQAAAQRAADGYALEIAAIELARDTISELARNIHREFAPQLNRRVGEIIGTITAGRYRDVRISETVAVSTASPETGVPVQVSGLSAGTADQFYLAARLAIAELLTGRPELPLILDDCFVHYDESRLRNVLKFLAGLAGKHQIILLTCRRREEEILRELGLPLNVINLTGPEAMREANLA
ncbi:MAG: AAA family ATPase [bacterium]|jgi:uncharacterized protein YhaN